MGGVWRYRVAKDEKEGKLHFVYARYRSSNPTYRCGLTSIFNEGNTVEELRQLAEMLLKACDEPIIPLEEYGDENDDEGETNTEDAPLWTLGPD